MSNINSTTKQVFAPQTLTADTTYYNDASESITGAIGIHVHGHPSLIVSVGTLGVSTTGISVQALKYSTYGVTPTAVSVNGGDTFALLSANKAIAKIKLDETLKEFERLVASVMPVGGDAIVGVNVIGKAQNDSEMDAR